VVLPSRGRPARLDSLLASILSTVSDVARIEIVVLLDSDDCENYPRRNFGELKCNFFTGEPGRTMGQLNQDCTSRAQGDVIFFANDDVIFRTKGWDELLLNKVSLEPDSIYLMYPNDLFKGARLCTFPIMSRKFLLENLEILPKSYLGAFMDLHIMDIFKAYRLGSRISYLEEMICEHQHYRVHSKLLDETYKNRRRFGDDERFIQLSTQRAEIVSRLEKSPLSRAKFFGEDSIFQILLGQADIYWKLKLFVYMTARRVYKRATLYKA
jgi:hypothetical protein